MLMYHENTRDIGKAEMYAKGWRGHVACTAGEVAKLITSYATSPYMWASGIRKKENFRVADWVGLDFDKGMTLEEAKKTFDPYLHIIGTTKSHQKQKGVEPPCDRYRVMLRLATTVKNPEQMEMTVKSLMRKYGADAKATDNARYFWPCSEIVVCKYYGKVLHPIDIEEVRKARERANNRMMQRIKKREHFFPGRQIPASVKKKLEYGVQPGQRNTACYGFGADLGKKGYSDTEILEMVVSGGSIIASDFTEKEALGAIRSGMKKN